MVHMFCWEDAQPLEDFSLTTPPSEENQQLTVAVKSSRSLDFFASSLLQQNAPEGNTSLSLKSGANALFQLYLIFRL